MSKITCLIMLLLFMVASFSVSALNFEVTAETTDCSGGMGFTSFDSRDLFKIQSGNCIDPNTGKKLQQVLLKSKSNLTRFDVLWVTQEEARNIMGQIKEIKTGKIKHLTRPEVIIEKETIIKHEQLPAPVKQPVSTVRGEFPGPSINIVDPPIGNSRSNTNIITPVDAATRTVVGKIDSPAGLLSLTINGKSQEVDPRGMFKVDIAVSGSKTPVSIVAVDNQGKQNSVEFRLLQEEPLEQRSSATSQDSGTEKGFFGKYHALVIANNQYKFLDDLSTPKNDVDAITEILRNRYGFTITRLNNATRYEILSALNEIRRNLTDKDNLMLYYAGHGEYDKANNRGHWLPVDAESNSTANWISTIAITDIINAMSVKHVLVVADSCYSGALTRAAITELDPGMTDETRMKWLRVIAKTRSRYVLTSGGVKPVIDDSGNGHSMFANAFIDVLNKNKDILEGSKLFREVKKRVTSRAEELNVAQSPQYGQLKRTGHEFGEFLFVGKN